MAINWNQAEYVAPKLQIVPEQLPVEAGVKVGAVLQDRFDKSYENLTKSEEALRQMALNANEVDRPEVERIYNQYSEQLKGIDKTDLHNARWKTLKLATEAANNYMSVAQRNKEIKAQEEMISKDPRYALKREEALQDFRKGLSSVGWDADKRTFSNLNISPYSAAADVDKVKYYTTYGKLMEPIVKSIKNKTVVPVDENGNETTLEKAPYFKTINTQGQVSILPASQLFRTLKDVGMSDDNVRAELERDARRTGKTVDQLFEEEHVPALKAVSKLLAQSKTQTVDQEDIKVNKNYGASTAGGVKSYQTLDNTFNLPMIPSQNKVEIDESYGNLQKSLSKLEFDENGNQIEKPLTDDVKSAIKNMPPWLNIPKVDLEKMIPGGKLTDFVPPKMYEYLKGKNLTDRQIKNAFENHANKMHKLVNTDYTFLNKSDQSQALNAILSATSGGEFVDENGETISKVEGLEKGNIKFNPSLSKFYIVKDNKQYYPKIELPTVITALEQAKELVDDFTNLNSKTNIVNMGDRIFTITKSDIRPDGTYTGTIGEVQEVGGEQGSKKYKQITKPTIYDTKQGGTDLLPTPVKAIILNLLKESTNQLGVIGVQ
jgi:hypothetical protein